MKILGCDLHARQQSIAMVDTETGELTEKTLSHAGNEVREFYAGLEGPVVVGIEATGAMQWFLELLEELGIVCRVGHPAKIRAAETRKQKHDRRDARLMLDLLIREDGFPEIWMPSSEQRDLRTLLRDRHQWVKIRTRVQHIAGHSTQSRTAARPRSVDCNWAEGTARLVSARLHQSKARRTAALIRAITAADPGAGRTSRKTSPATAPGAPLVDASRCGTSDSIGDGGVPGRPEPLRQWQERSQLHRNDPMRPAVSGSGWGN
jgi:Transposase